MKFAFLIMGEFDSSKDYASIHENEAQMIGVASIEEARNVARKLQEENGAREIIEATGNKLPIGYATHLPEQDVVYAKTFPNG